MSAFSHPILAVKGPVDQILYLQLVLAGPGAEERQKRSKRQRYKGEIKTERKLKNGAFTAIESGCHL